MGTKALFVGLLTIGFATHIQAQNTETPVGMTVTAVNIDFGVNASYSLITNDDYLNMRNTAVDQSMFISNPEDYELQSYSGAGGSFAPSISLGFTPYSKKLGKLNYNREFRVRLGGSFGGRRSFFYTSETRTPYDTLVSTVGNPDLYVDSVYYHNPNYVETIYELNVGASYLFKTNAANRWHFYTGFGAEYGFSVQDYVTIYNQEGSYYAENGEESNYDYNYYYEPEYDDNSTTSKSKITSNSHFFRVFIPIGVNFRIANKNDFWKRVNLYTQMSPGLEFHTVTDVGTFTNPFTSIALVGIRYTVD